MRRIVALLRGVNLAARNRVAMADLRALVEDLGHADVRTHLQSGNVVLSAAGRPADVARGIEQAIAERLGLRVDVLVRTGEQMSRIVAADPFGEAAADPSRHLVAFLPGRPDRAALRRIGELDLEPERIVVVGTEVHVWCPNGQQRSPAMAALSKHPLAPTSTVRNWRTVTRLEEMARG